MVKNVFLVVALFAFCFAAVLVNAQTDTGLVLSDGEAWVKKTDNLRSGYIFKADGTYLSINDYDGEKVGEWTIKSDGTWTVKGKELTIRASNYSLSYNFTVSGNALSLDFLGSVETYTKTSGIKPAK